MVRYVVRKEYVLSSLDESTTVYAILYSRHGLSSIAPSYDPDADHGRGWGIRIRAADTGMPQ